jgi:LmbE family N-acetylglucosaminyl deacetylase
MLNLPVNWSGIRQVLCLGAHSDDIEIGCSGMQMELATRVSGVRFLWVVFSADEVRDAESRAAAKAMLGGEETVSVRTARFRMSYFPHVGSEIKDYMESVKTLISPDLVFTHWLGDRHQDHRLIAELTWNTFRDHRIFEYEIPKYEGDLGQPSVFVPLAQKTVERKLEVLETCFASQKHRPWFRTEVFRALMCLRGVECRAPSGYAEAFHVRKLVL